MYRTRVKHKHRYTRIICGVRRNEKRLNAETKDTRAGTTGALRIVFNININLRVRIINRRNREFEV
jgi:hypothetical protein